MAKFKVITKHIKLLNSGRNIQFISIVSLFLVILALPLFVIENQQKQSISQHASGNLAQCSACTPGQGQCQLGMSCNNAIHICEIQSGTHGSACNLSSPTCTECNAGLACIGSNGYWTSSGPGTCQNYTTCADGTECGEGYSCQQVPNFPGNYQCAGSSSPTNTPTNTPVPQNTPTPTVSTTCTVPGQICGTNMVCDNGLRCVQVCVAGTTQAGCYCGTPTNPYFCINNSLGCSNGVCVTTNIPTPTTAICGTTLGQHCNAVWTDKSTYTTSEQTKVCYSVAASEQISLTRTKPDGSTETILPTGTDDGTGDCRTISNSSAGNYTVYLNTPNSTVNTSYTVTGQADTCSTQGTNYSCMNPNCVSGYSPANSGTCSDSGSVCCVADTQQPTNTPEPTATDTPVPPQATDTPTNNNATDTPEVATDTPAGPTDTPGGPTDTPNPDTTDTPTPTGNQNNNPIYASLAVKLEGIDIGAKTGLGYKINNNPQNPQKFLTITIYGANDDPNKVGPVTTVYDAVSFNTQTGQFVNKNLDLSFGTGFDFPGGSYKVFVKVAGYLRKSLGTITITTDGRTINQLTPSAVPQLLAGDINDDDNIDILDYNQLVACFPNTPEQGNFCSPAADINDNGNKNDNDWNDDLTILLKNFGKTGDMDSQTPAPSPTP